MGGNGKHRWKFSFHRSSSKLDPKQPRKEFTCPISGSLMSDPVVVASGQTFERVAVQVCKDLHFSPKLEDGTRPDFSTVIPNLAIKTTILNWCDESRTEHPRAPDYASVERQVREAMAALGEDDRIRVSEKELLKAVADNPPVIFSHAATELGPRVNHFNSGSSSEESVIIIPPSPGTPLPLTIRPTCFSSSSSSCEIEIENPNAPASEEEEGILKKLTSGEVFEQEEGVIALRKITRNKEEARVSLCTARVLLALRGLIASRYGVVQVNAVASLVNLSLEKQNKVRIVRSGFVPFLIDVLKEGLGESQEHAAGALFSLALDDDNKMAIGVLGALHPLMHALRAESQRTRHDSALALYHLTLVQSNRVKLVKLGVIPTLLSMVVAGNLASRVLLILCNLAVCTEGRTAMLDANAVECLVGLLRGNELDSEATRENCVAALYALSHRSLRFKGLAKDARVVEVLKEVEETGTERAREKARKVLHMLRTVGDGDGEEDEEFFDSAGLTRNRYRVGAARNHNLVNTTTLTILLLSKVVNADSNDVENVIRLGGAS
ncbi:U-box domain-containing protein 38, partial [Mucuna pruriens]